MLKPVDRETTGMLPKEHIARCIMLQVFISDYKRI